MNKILAAITDNDDGTFTIILTDAQNINNSIEINCESQWNANNIYSALIGNSSNVI